MDELKPLFDGPFDCLTHVFGTDSDTGDDAAGPAAVPNGACGRVKLGADSTRPAAPLHGAAAAAQAGPRSDPADGACATPDDRIALACLKFVQRERAEKKETVLTAPDTPFDTYADLTPASHHQTMPQTRQCVIQSRCKWRAWRLLRRRAAQQLRRHRQSEQKIWRRRLPRAWQRHTTAHTHRLPLHCQAHRSLISPLGQLQQFDSTLRT